MHATGSNCKSPTKIFLTPFSYPLSPHTPPTPHFHTLYLIIGARATQRAQLLITQSTVAYPTDLGPMHDDGVELVGV